MPYVSNGKQICYCFVFSPLLLVLLLGVSLSRFLKNATANFDEIFNFFSIQKCNKKCNKKTCHFIIISGPQILKIHCFCLFMIFLKGSSKEL